MLNQLPGSISLLNRPKMFRRGLLGTPTDRLGCSKQRSHYLAIKSTEGFLRKLKKSEITHPKVEGFQNLWYP
jgi:hypothetical protein